MAKKIKDFGEKIGGARKDMFRKDGLREDDIRDLYDAEIKKYVKRDSVWPLPDAEKLVNDGMPAFVVFWQRKMRLFVSAYPNLIVGKNVRDSAEIYIRTVRELKELVSNVRTEADIADFYKQLKEHPMEDWRLNITVSKLKFSVWNLNSMKQKCIQSGFPHKQKRIAGKRKPMFIPPKLETIERTGPDYRHGRNCDEISWQKAYAFRGVEFGNWTSQKVRQLSMNYAYDALKDMAHILEIEDKDIAFEGRLALAFGARGISYASAHYEPLREVINLTKFNGAGCTAHEWCHAMDDILAKHCGITSGHLASEATCEEKKKLPDSFNKLVKALKVDCEGQKTNYLLGSEQFDKHWAKDSHGYWSSNAEMLARAFACYIKDCIGGKSDYLIAHADVYKFQYDNECLCAIPQDEEREYFNELFDILFFDLKEMGFFHERKDEESVIVHPSETAEYAYALSVDDDGQMRLCV